ncbi:response regulator [Variovorax arabinosiphilus]|uniref:response regulator n=1 Tax=Variovorax arabinosiphilus TaxID=3053498 RepID=UPI002575CE09|nr:MULTISPECIES: response regulator [unclassified Variovorax]MDM0118800.1 response regulator [Variovorax sp. J2L1-78]MDM0129225.1 response regulator [Variovorax sp. J2L1-63]MDM0232988.1 response regulator [Variovorax sp. J2R1-6]
MRLLLVEDEAEMAAWLMRAFKQSGFVADHAPDAATAESLLAAGDYDAVVLDLRLPDRHGLALLVDLRAAGNRTPVLVLTAEGSVQDRVRGLNAGADDFLGKPFAIEELEARLDALVRRARGTTHTALQCGSLMRTNGSRAFTLAGQLLQLTPRESAALSVLLARSGSPVEKAQLSAKVFPADSDAGPDAIELVLHRLRRKLDGGDVRIVTVRGLGYMLESIAHDKPAG